MDDPEKEKFILKAVEKIRQLRKKVEEARKNKEEMSDIMQDIQSEIKVIKKESEFLFESHKANMSPEELESYIQNPSNFSKEDWALLEAIKFETEQCKKEIIKSNEVEDVEDLIHKKSKGKGLKKSPGKRLKNNKYI